MTNAPSTPPAPPTLLRRAKTAVRSSLAAGTRFRSAIRRRLRRPNLFDLTTGERFGVVINAPSEMTVSERIFLYSLVRGSRPRRTLEIGSNLGGSAAIMCAALEDIVGFKGAKHEGTIVGVDPFPRIQVPQADFLGRFTVVKQPSPEGIPEAARIAGGRFDFALIDGIHIHDQVIKDVEGLLPHFDVGGYLLFHDAFHHGVSVAIAELLERHPELHDCGYPCGKPALSVATGEVAYGGFRMLRLGAKVVEPFDWIELECAGRGMPLPLRTDDVLNHDKAWLCRVGEPCAFCKKQRAAAAAKA